ncbi:MULTISPECIES: ribokinase [Vagococcus]|uniref:Ribokinase n=1 Tax=Vagococcus fluvialis bH819 TaxID=1255619 RepID=A0A1X6WKG1_9ENTE|nr:MULTISPECIES: ribokinase [Vagococcus]SLM84768.1 Ribokinase [Vagococcus fluvialis bH819]HCM89772.1 ribokinase [Vagococcus sp.]
MNTITVIGSINLDTTLRVSQMPKPGETMHAKEHFTAGGGKGANQAVAAKRSGADTYFIGAVGNDGAGTVMSELLEQEEIDTTGVIKLDNQSTGQAFITVDDAGENSILIFSGANNSFTPEDVQKSTDIIGKSDFLISQFESAINSTTEAFNIARSKQVKTILNPAPALSEMPKELLSVTDMIIPNETETEILTGIKVTDEKSLKEAADYLHDLGIEAVIITIGSKGAFYDVNGKSGIVPAFKVKAVDTTAAGDTFIGALSTILKTDYSNIEEAITYGNKASSLTVQRYGAQPSIPYKNELV